MKIIYLLLIFSSCFGVELNYAPKIENPESEKALVLVVCSYNNEKYYKGNLDSIFSQQYNNYRVIYINDASTDRTGELVQKYIIKHGLSDKVTYIENEVNQKAMYNIYYAVHGCKNDDIILLVDGDDKLFGTKALFRINQAFSDNKVWFTYGQYKNGNSKPTPRRVLEEGKHRKYKYQWSHIRTFYAGLFKLIPKYKFIFRGKFIESAWDIPITLHLIDLARDHTYFIPDIIYEYNKFNPINDYRIRLKSQQFFCRYCYRQEPLRFFCKSKNDFL